MSAARRAFVIRHLAAVALATSAVSASAATFTWTGAGGAVSNSNWNSSLNWVGGVAPTGSGAGDTLIFGAANSRAPSVNNINNFILSATSGSALRFITATNYVISGSAVVLNGNVSQTAASTVSIANDIKLARSSTFSLSNANGTITASGVISNQTSGSAAGLSKTGPGTLILSANNTYTGDTTVTGGTLVVNGSNTATAVSVGSGATLRGVGSVGDVSIVGGIVNAGTNGSSGILKVASLTLDADSTSIFAISGTGHGTGYNSIRSAGAVNYGDSLLQLSMPSTKLPNYTYYQLFEGTSYSGSVSSIANVTYAGKDWVFTETSPGEWKTDYDFDLGQQLIFTSANGTLTVVPEPTSLAMVGVAGGIAGVVGLRRRKGRETATNC